jgi:TPR repeat protein
MDGAAPVSSHFVPTEAAVDAANALGASQQDPKEQFAEAVRQQRRGYVSTAAALMAEAMERLSSAECEALERPNDMGEIARLYQRVADDQKNRVAQFRFGRCAHLGSGVGRDTEQGAHYYRLAAEAGLGLAQLAYGRCLYYGIGVLEDEEEALEWLLKGAQTETGLPSEC